VSNKSYLKLTRVEILTLGGVTANMLFWGRGSCMGLAMVPLDRALLSSYRLSIVSILLSVTVWPQCGMKIITGGSDP